jgi:hypothetical protein
MEMQWIKKVAKGMLAAREQAPPPHRNRIATTTLQQKPAVLGVVGPGDGRGAIAGGAARALRSNGSSWLF